MSRLEKSPDSCLGGVFYVVRATVGYFIIEAMPEEMFRRLKRDRSLTTRMDRMPFSTRSQAQNRVIELTAGKATPKARAATNGD
jgi:hypothetical protein